MYKFTGKELDTETGLYYFGARYYDARVSRWISTDPAFADGKYFPKPNDYDTEHDFYWYLQQDGSKKLAGLGGVFNAVNMDVYHYAGNNPVKLVDPDGEVSFIVGAAIGFVTSSTTEIAGHWTDTGNGTMSNLLDATKATFTDSKSLKSIATSTIIGAVTSGLSSAVTTTKMATTVAKVAKTAAGNVLKNTVIGGAGATTNYITQSIINGNEITFDDSIGAFAEGAIVSGVLTMTGEAFKVYGIPKTFDMTTKKGGIRHPTVNYSKPNGGSAAFGSLLPYSGDVLMPIYNAFKENR